MQELTIFNREEALTEVAAEKNRGRTDVSKWSSSSSEAAKPAGRKTRNGHTGTNNGRALSNGHLQFRDNVAFEEDQASQKDS